MKTPLSTYQALSEQDYGPWLDRLTLFEVNGVYYLQEEFGYCKPYDSNWYVLDAKPETSLEEVFGERSGGWCGSGDTKELEYALGVALAKCAGPC